MSTKVGKVVGGAHTWHMGKINVKSHFPSTLKLHAGRGVKGGGGLGLRHAFRAPRMCLMTWSAFFPYDFQL